MPDYRLNNPAGVDYKWVLEDLPLFWRPRIAEIDVAPDLDPDEMLRARDAAKLAYMNAPCHHPHMGGKLPDPEWLKHSLRLHR